MLIALTVIILTHVHSAPLFDDHLICSEVPPVILETILGGAFNPRYMSVDRPAEVDGEAASKRTISVKEDFYVRDNYTSEVTSDPAWDINSHVQISKKTHGKKRSKRAGVDYLQQWQCESRIDWTDLGPDYFPRYLRSVVCVSRKCWFGLYTCKPRSFTVKLLRRKSGYCTRGSQRGTRVTLIGLPRELKELWVWEERAVNFCCDCTRT